MIAWAIDTARSSGLFDHVIVSTDDNEIAEVARNWGAETPFMRPANLADDMTPTVPVVAHAVESCIESGWRVETACCIYPCAPLLQADDLVASLDTLKQKSADFVYPVTEYAHPVQRCMRRLPDGKMQFFNPEFEMTRTQDLETAYHDAGQFYWGTAQAWLAHRKMHTDGLGMPIPNWRVVDIDSEDDWARAELVFESVRG